MTTYVQNLTEILDREALPAGGIISGDVDYAADGLIFRGYHAVPPRTAPTRAFSSCTIGSA